MSQQQRAGDVTADDDALTDDELLAEEEALAALDPARPTEHQLAGGGNRGLAWLLTIGGALGTWASVMLILSTQKLLRDPDAALGCDINPLIGCGKFVLSWQASVLGPPNAVLGTIGFAVVTATGVALLGGGRLPRVYWVLLMAGSVLAAVWITWFQYQAFTNLRGLCPYCLVVWAVTIPIVVNVWARGLQGRHLPAPEGLRRFLVQDRALVITVWYAVVLLLIGVVFWDQWMLIL
ncbi:vitamin K epoxide reductase family protein [Georgenia satyanarayanai]|uniref:vitamin K epoxide reductase family protein n=1 Tax=Georgenia satyanarayanai TaxID=860221 RepID=UPI0012657BBE|nr:vitamin K epoxide reductase family protein [Georgenia satyanarayanai]